MRPWITYSSPDFNAAHDFAALGADYETAHQIATTQIGWAQVRFLRQRALVDWAVPWLERHRR